MTYDLGNCLILNLKTFANFSFFINGTTVYEDRIADLCYQILIGLRVMHDYLGMVHRDIKPANILVSNTREVDRSKPFGISYLICDFGLAAPTNEPRAAAGSISYMAPELLRIYHTTQKEAVVDKSDIWSFGSTIVELFRGPTETIGTVGTCLKNPKMMARDISASQYLRHFLKVCLRDDFHSRPTASELLEHRFIKSHGFT